MNVTSLDSITKNILLKRNYSLHFYLDYLIHAKDCLRELSLDETIQTLRYKVLPLNDNHAIEIPNDYVDYANVSVRVGQYLRPLVEDSKLSLVPNYDSSFNIQPYNHGVASDPNNQLQLYNGYLTPYWWMANWDAFGENLGRQFGGVGSYSDTFKENRARNEIKINENLSVDEVVLEYVGNGMDADSATHIDAYAQQTIEAYAQWQFKANNRTYNLGDVQVAEQQYIRERLIYRARKSDLTIDRLKRIVQRNSISIKY